MYLQSTFTTQSEFETIMVSTSLQGRSFHCLSHILRITCFSAGDIIFIIALFSMFIISKLYLSAGGTIFIISKLCLIFFLFNRSSYQGSKARKSRLWRLNFFETACQVENGIRAKLIWSKKEKRINLKSALRRKVDLKMDAWHWCKPNHLLLTKDFYPEKKFKPI